MHEELSVAKIPLLAQLQKEALFTGSRKITETLERPCPHKPLSGFPEWPDVGHCRGLLSLSHLFETFGPLNHVVSKCS